MPQKFEGNNPNLISILEGGVVSIPATVTERAKLIIGDQYDLYWLASRPMVLLFKHSKYGYTLSPQGNKGASKFTTRKFNNEVFRGRSILPIFNLEPLINCVPGYEIGVMVEDVPWIAHPYDKPSLKHFTDNDYGLYQLLDAEGKILRIGEGLLKQRFQSHLREQWTDVVKFRHFLITADNSVSQKEDGCIYEKVFLYQHFGNAGDLPKYNKILR